MRPYFRLVLWPTLVVSLVILALVEVVFLAEKFTGLLDRVVTTGGDAWDLVRLLLWEVPEILDLALPAALLVGVQSAVGRARQNGELVVVTAAGAPVRGLVTGMLLVGLLCGLFSFAISGVVAPAASYAQRVALHALTVNHVARRIAEPGRSGSTFTAEGADFVATGRPGQPASLMVRRPRGAKPWRYAFAGDWTVTGPEEDGEGHFRLGEVTAFGDLPELTDQIAEARLNRIAAGSVNVGFEMEDILPVLDRTPREEERTVLPAVQSLFAGEALAEAIEPRRVALIWARAVLVPTAVLMALLAVWGGTVPRLRAFALPLALVALVIGDLVVRAWLGGIAPGLGLWLACGTAAAAMLGLPLLLLARAGEALIRPGRG